MVLIFMNSLGIYPSSLFTLQTYSFTRYMSQRREYQDPQRVVEPGGRQAAPECVGQSESAT
jgi:hypothetical protein